MCISKVYTRRETRLSFHWQLKSVKREVSWHRAMFQYASDHYAVILTQPVIFMKNQHNTISSTNNSMEKVWSKDSLAVSGYDGKNFQNNQSELALWLTIHCVFHKINESKNTFWCTSIYSKLFFLYCLWRYLRYHFC